MQEKDWIVLIFPILCNGILLFVFTQFIETRKKRKQQARYIHQNLIREYDKIARSILYVFYENQDTILQSLNESLPAFISFSRKNKERLQKYSQKISDIEETWNMIVKQVRFVQDNEKGIINGRSGEIVASLVDKLFDNLLEIAQICISDIYEEGEYIA